jgi:hypothetical protein
VTRSFVLRNAIYSVSVLGIRPLDVFGIQANDILDPRTELGAVLLLQ